jgi:hypothetical protein
MGDRASTPFRDPVALTVGALAVYRATRLVVADEVTRPAREAIVLNTPDSRLAYLVTCPWCVSVWAAVAWAGLVAAAPAVAAPVGAALAWSAVSGLLSSLE